MIQALSIKRAFSALATLLLLVLFIFCLGALVPIDPAAAALGDNASEASYAKVKEALGLNLPLWKQVGLYFSGLLKLDLGVSSLTGHPVLRDLYRVVPPTIELSFFSLLFGLLFGVPLGVMSAWKRTKSWLYIQKVQLALYSIPNFLLAMCLLLVFYVFLGVLPGPGRVALEHEHSIKTGAILLDGILQRDGALFISGLKYLVLPTLVLGIMCMVKISRFTHSLMVEQLGQPFIMTAMMKGLSINTVVWKHAFRAIWLPLLTVVVLSFAALLEGALIVETVFSRPGVGSYMVQSLLAMDRNAIVGATLLVGILFVGLNTLIDYLTHRLDPRTKK